MLYISRNTVRGHLQHVYAKLNVHSREESHRDRGAVEATAGRGQDVG